MTTDNWETQDGYISQGDVISYVTLANAVVAGECLGFGTPAQNKIVMQKYSGEANAVAVALKGGATGDVIPACFYGVVKMLAFSTITVGGAVINSMTAGTTVTYGAITPLTATDTGNCCDVLLSNNGTGTAWILGMALQAGTTVGDELLVLVGGFGR